jgi:hypothetical protein
MGTRTGDLSTSVINYLFLLLVSGAGDLSTGTGTSVINYLFLLAASGAEWVRVVPVWDAFTWITHAS